MRSPPRAHWPEYLMEAAELGIFMLSACVFTALIELPGSPVQGALPDPSVRRALVGLAMGLSAAAIIYSPWGGRSGAHFNPAVTLTFWRLGKVESRDALFYVGAQFAGGVTGVLAGAALLGASLSDPPLRWVATVPGPPGPAVAFAAEAVISFLLMSVVLRVSNTPRIACWTGVCAACLVAGYIAFEAPLSGLSMNPARTFASAAPGRVWEALWVYFTAPPLGMLLAAEVYVRHHGDADVRCAKLDHPAGVPCIFRCGYREAAAGGPSGGYREAAAVREPSGGESR